jgi:hypothetical protein
MAIRWRLLHQVALATVLVVGVAGCGSGSSQPAKTTAPATASGPATATGAASASAAAHRPVGGPVPAGFTVVSFTTSRGTTYLLGAAPCKAEPCTSVVRSDGAGWRGVPAPRVALATRDLSTRPTTVRDIRFATPADGWAFGGALWSTHDGAAHWREIDAGGQVWDLGSDGTTTFAVVGSCSAGGTCALRLRSTPAGLDRWTDVPGVAATGSEGRIGLGGGTAVVSLGSGNVFLRRGGTWARTTPPCASGAPVVEPSVSSRRIFALCGEGAAGSTYYTVSYSDDRAATWTTLPIGPRPLQLSNGPFLSVTAASSALLFAASGASDVGGTVMLSRNGGRTWVTASGHGGLPDLVGAAGGGWRYVGASDRAHVTALAAVPHRSYWTSSDGGRAWQRITPG